MSLKNKFVKEMFKMCSAAAQQACMKAPSHKLSCWTKPNPLTTLIATLYAASIAIERERETEQSAGHAAGECDGMRMLCR